MHKLILRTALIHVLVLSSTAWAQAQVEPHTLSMAYDAKAVDTPPTRAKTTCNVNLKPAVDARLNKDTLGTNFANPLLSGDASVWTTTGLQNLASYGFGVSTGSTNEREKLLILSPHITRAYTWQVGLKLFGTVVVKIDYTRPDGSTERKTYRATGDKTNMWGRDDEYMTALNYAFNNMLSKVAADLEKECGSKIS